MPVVGVVGAEERGAEWEEMEMGTETRTRIGMGAAVTANNING